MTAPIPIQLHERPPTARPLGIVGAFDCPEDAEAAVATLDAAGFDLKRLALIAREAPSGEHLLGCAATGVGLRFWGHAGPTECAAARALLRGAAQRALRRR